MISYLIKSMVIAALLLTFYGLCLLPEKMNRFKRWYLLLALVASLIIPLLPLQVNMLPVHVHLNIPSPNYLLNKATPSPTTQLSISGLQGNIAQGANPSSQWTTLIYIYCLISLILIIRLTWQFLRFQQYIRRHPVQRKEGIQLIILDQGEVSFSFLRYICIAPPDIDPHTGTPLKDIYMHELAHARQLHSLDILFISFVQTLCWWNPFLFLYKRAIRLNHEFLADEEVLATNTPFSNYQHLLLSRVQIKQAHQLASTSIYSLTKKRFQMMTKQRSKRKIRLLQIASACLVAACLLILSQPTVAQDTAKQPTTNSQKTNPGKSLKPTSKTGVSQAQFDDYQKQIASHLTINGKTENWHFKDGEEHLQQDLSKTYQKMSPAQQKLTRRLPPPPPPLPYPHKAKKALRVPPPPPPPISRKGKKAAPAPPVPPAPPKAPQITGSEKLYTTYGKGNDRC